MSVTELFKTSITEEMERLGEEVKTLSEPLNEETFWKKPMEPSNSVGHLVLHLVGNLNHFIGAHIGGTGYTRDREREFTETETPSKEEALSRLSETISMVRRVVMGLSEDQLQQAHPEARFGTVLRALLHLQAHFALHRGQMSYLVRLV